MLTIDLRLGRSAVLDGDELTLEELHYDRKSGRQNLTVRFRGQLFDLPKFKQVELLTSSGRSGLVTFKKRAGAKGAKISFVFPGVAIQRVRRSPDVDVQLSGNNK